MATDGDTRARDGGVEIFSLLSLDNAAAGEQEMKEWVDGTTTGDKHVELDVVWLEAAACRFCFVEEAFSLSYAKHPCVLTKRDSSTCRSAPTLDFFLLRVVYSIVVRLAGRERGG